VVRDARIGQRVSGENRAGDQLAQPCLLIGDGRIQHLAREHALWKVVDPLETADTAGDHDLAEVPERLQHHLRGLPVPHAASAAAPLEVARGERPSLADRGPHFFGQLRRPRASRRQESRTYSGVIQAR
jgi:hypothetical protein